jgi:hypothetical protein
MDIPRNPRQVQLTRGSISEADDIVNAHSSEIRGVLDFGSHRWRGMQLVAAVDLDCTVILKRINKESIKDQQTEQCRIGKENGEG